MADPRPLWTDAELLNLALLEWGRQIRGNSAPHYCMPAWEFLGARLHSHAGEWTPASLSVELSLLQWRCVDVATQERAQRLLAYHYANQLVSDVERSRRYEMPRSTYQRAVKSACTTLLQFWLPNRVETDAPRP